MLRPNELAETCESLYPYLQIELLCQKFLTEKDRELKDRERRAIKLPYLTKEEMFQEYVLKELDISEIKKALEVSSTLILMSPPAIHSNFSAFPQLLKAYANKVSDLGIKYDKCSPEEKAFRAKLALIEDWLVFSTNSDYPQDNYSINTLVKRTVSKKDVGMPRSGFGDIKDKGYLYYYLQELKFVIQNTDNSQKWGNFVAHAIGCNLFQQKSYPHIYWWQNGGLPGGAKKEQWVQAGQTGWEALDSRMPQLDDHAWNNGNRLRPFALEENFEPLMLKLLEAFELTLQKDKGRNIFSSFVFLESASLDDLVLIHTPAVTEALKKIVEAGVPNYWSVNKDVDSQISGFSLSAWNVLKKWGGEQIWEKERYSKMMGRFDQIEQELQIDPRPGAKVISEMFKIAEPEPVLVHKAKTPSP